jgi:hypothetical protein
MAARNCNYVFLQTLIFLDYFKVIYTIRFKHVLVLVVTHTMKAQ